MSEWISVLERDPEALGEYLVVVKDKWGQEIYLWDWTPAKPHGYWESMSDNVTHWMPKPELPDD